MPNAMIQNGTVYAIVSDHLGSVRLVVDTTTGTVMQRIDYDEWGNVTSETNPGFQPFGFAGGLYDPDTKLVRFGARDYDPEVGRWTAKDPIRFEGSTNFHVYVGDDLVNSIDPRGRQAQGLNKMERMLLDEATKIRNETTADPTGAANPRRCRVLRIDCQARDVGASQDFAMPGSPLQTFCNALYVYCRQGGPPPARNLKCPPGEAAAARESGRRSMTDNQTSRGKKVE